MEVYLKKISQTPIGFSENELKEFTNGLSSNETICLQYLTAKNPTGVSVSSFNQSFNNYVNDFLMKDVNILLIYKIKLNYLIINAIKAEPNQYSFMQVNSIKIDTENLSESENALITNPSVLKTAYALYLRIIPKSKDKTKQDDKDDVNDKFALGTRRNYVRVFEDLDKQKGISIFSSFKKASTAEIIDNISSLINNKSDEIVNSINSVYHHALSASLKQYKVFFDNWISKGILDLNDIDSNDSDKHDDKSNQDYPLNMILYGAPGTGKTYKTIDYAVAIADKQNLDDTKRKDRDDLMQTYHDFCVEGRIAFTTFHQSYTYEDFIQGLRPVISNNNEASASNSLKFEWKDGIFKQIADRASNDEHNNYVIIIDEINRANISRVLGELITLLEEDKRGELWTVSLPSGDKFYVPKNLYIVGTMNTADKSISNIDVALRRRFNFIEEPVDLEKVDSETLRKVLEKINDQLIKLQKSTDLLIGQAYFINKTINDLPNILNDKVIPLLYEYFDDDNDVKKKVKGIIDEVVKIDNLGCKVVDNPYGRIKVEKNN